MSKLSTKSVLRYPGGKFRARNILTEYIPENTKTVLSPFVGGGSFELHLTSQGIKVNGYDGFPVLTNFWQHLLLYPIELSNLLKPWLGKIDSETFKNFQKDLKEEIDSTQQDISHAVKFFIVNRCSFSGATLSGGYSKASSTQRFTQSVVDKIEKFENPLITVQQGLFEETLSYVGQENDLIFLDPPYLLPATKNSLYGIGGNLHKDFNHQLLKDLVTATRKPFLLTYNNTPEIRELWQEYDIREAEWAYGMNASKQSSEIIIKNY